MGPPTLYTLFAQNPLIDRLTSLFKLLYAIQFLVLIYTFTYVEDLTSHSRTREWTLQINNIFKSYQIHMVKHDEEINSLGQLVVSLTREILDTNRKILELEKQVAEKEKHTSEVETKTNLNVKDLEKRITELEKKQSEPIKDKT